MTQLQRDRFLLMASLWAVIIFVFSPASTSMGYYLLPLVRDFHSSRGTVSIIAAALAVASGLAYPLAGWLVDRIEAKWMMTAGIVIISLGYILASRSHSIQGLIVAFAVIGIGMAAGTLIPVWVVTLAWFTERRGLAIGLAVAGMTIGFTISPLIIGHLLLTYSWRQTMVWTIVPMVVIPLPMVHLWVRSHPPRVEGQAETAASLPGLTMGPALSTLSFYFVALLCVCVVLAWNLFFVNLVSYLRTVGFSERAGVTVLGLQAIFAIVGFLGNGWLADRIGPRGMMVIGFCYLAVAVLCLRYARPTEAGMVFLVIFMVFYACAGSLNNFTSLIVVNSFGQRALGSLLGVLNFLAATFCQSSGPVIAGKIYDKTGSYNLVFDLAWVLVVIGIVATWAIYPVKGHDEVAGAQPASAALAQ